MSEQNQHAGEHGAAIQDAVAKLPPFGEFTLPPGKHRVSLYLDKPVILRGLGLDSVLIPIDDTVPAVVVASQNVYLLDCAIEHEKGEAGIALQCHPNCPPNLHNVAIRGTVVTRLGHPTAQASAVTSNNNASTTAQQNVVGRTPSYSSLRRVAAPRPESDNDRTERELRARAFAQRQLGRSGLIHVLEHHRWAVNACRFVPGTPYAVSASADESLVLWNVRLGQTVRVWRGGHHAAVLTLACSRDGKYALSGGADKKIVLWDVEKGTPIISAEGHTEAVRSVAIAADGKHAMSASEDGTVAIWEMPHLRKIHSLAGHGRWVTGCAVSPDNIHAASTSGDGSIIYWHMPTGDEIRRFGGGHFGAVTSIAFTPDGKSILTGGTDRKAVMWNVESGDPYRTFESVHEDMITNVAVSPDGRRIATTGKDHLVAIWEIRTGLPVEKLWRHQEMVLCADFDETGDWLLSSGLDRAVLFWNLAPIESLAQRLARQHGNDLVKLQYQYAVPPRQNFETTAQYQARVANAPKPLMRTTGIKLPLLFEEEGMDADVGKMIVNISGHRGVVKIAANEAKRIHEMKDLVYAEGTRRLFDDLSGYTVEDAFLVHPETGKKYWVDFEDQSVAV